MTAWRPGTGLFLNYTTPPTGTTPACFYRNTSDPSDVNVYSELCPEAEGGSVPAPEDTWQLR